MPSVPALDQWYQQEEAKYNQKIRNLSAEVESLQKNKDDSGKELEKVLTDLEEAKTRLANINTEVLDALKVIDENKEATEKKLSDRDAAQSKKESDLSDKEKLLLSNEASLNGRVHALEGEKQNILDLITEARHAVLNALVKIETDLKAV